MNPTLLPIADFPFRLVAAIFPHPDDSAIGCGGLMCRLNRFSQPIRPTLAAIVLTSGHRGVSDEYLREYLAETSLLSWPSDATEVIRRKTLIREQEAKAEAASLGVDSVQCLNLPDLYERHSVAPEEIQRLAQALGELARPLPASAPRLLLLPRLDDPHPVHSLGSQLVSEALIQMPGWTVWHYETTWMSLNPRDVTTIVSLTSNDIACKLDALKQHRSQLARTDFVKVVRDMAEVKAQTLNEILFGFGKDGTQLGAFVELFQQRGAVTLIP